MCKASQTSTIFCKCLRSQPLIKVDQLEKKFGTVKALDGASFSADDGKITALLGPNGAGTVSYTHLTLPTKRIV